MRGAWYWYVEDAYDGNVVKIHEEKKDYVRGQYWVLPAKIKVPCKRKDGTPDYVLENWRLYMQPRWFVERDVPGVNSAHGLNCEWVCVMRQPAPVYKRTMKGVDVCETCGHEETIWETERVS